MAKHVIFLGAGASASSGYPLANQLRLQLSSRVHLRKALRAAYKAESNARESAPIDDRTNYTFLQKSDDFFAEQIEAIKLFRGGAFASVDEFCKLVGQNQELAGFVDHMRTLSRFVLGTMNPEDTFADSDYYPFVQSLFSTNLYELRDDIAVMTINYDPHLEYVLLTAAKERADAKGHRLSLSDINSLTSGFSAPDDVKWSECLRNFCLLKLHGSIYEPCHGFGFDLFFENDLETRIKRLGGVDLIVKPPPVLFPWELFDENGAFFPNRFPNYSRLFRAIWAKARTAIEIAETISFIGVSMHPFLSHGMKYLFKDRKNPVRIVVANPECAGIGGQHVTEQPKHSVENKARRLLQDAVPHVDKYLHSFFTFVSYPSFREFIQKELVRD